MWNKKRLELKWLKTKWKAQRFHHLIQRLWIVKDLFRDIYMQIKWSQNIVSTKSRKL